MTNDASIKKLILVPALITLAVTLLRLTGELMHWSKALFNPAAGGGGGLAGSGTGAPGLRPGRPRSGGDRHARRDPRELGHSLRRGSAELPRDEPDRQVAADRPAAPAHALDLVHHRGGDDLRRGRRGRD